jgi:hypothetical protein
VRIFRTSDPTQWMQGPITSYDATTGALNVTVPGTAGATGGAGTFSDWTVGLCGQIVRIERDWMRPRATIEVYC